MKKIFVTGFVILALFSVAVNAQDNIEKKKIEFLISSVENLSRPIFVSKKTHMNTGIVIVGMMGGLLSIGFSGLILGPLILSYILLMFDIYKNEFLGKKE